MKSIVELINELKGMDDLGRSLSQFLKRLRSYVAQRYRLGPRIARGKGRSRTRDRQAGSDRQFDPHHSECSRLAHQLQGRPRDHRREVAGDLAAPLSEGSDEN